MQVYAHHAPAPAHSLRIDLRSYVYKLALYTAHHCAMHQVSIVSGLPIVCKSGIKRVHTCVLCVYAPGALVYSQTRHNECWLSIAPCLPLAIYMTTQQYLYANRAMSYTSSSLERGEGRVGHGTCIHVWKFQTHTHFLNLCYPFGFSPIEVATNGLE